MKPLAKMVSVKIRKTQSLKKPRSGSKNPQSREKIQGVVTLQANYVEIQYLKSTCEKCGDKTLVK